MECDIDEVFASVAAANLSFLAWNERSDHIKTWLVDTVRCSERGCLVRSATSMLSPVSALMKSRSCPERFFSSMSLWASLKITPATFLMSWSGSVNDTSYRESISAVPSSSTAGEPRTPVTETVCRSGHSLISRKPLGSLLLRSREES